MKIELPTYQEPYHGRESTVGFNHLRWLAFDNENTLNH